jgi:hypothetical protein
VNGPEVDGRDTVCDGFERDELAGQQTAHVNDAFPPFDVTDLADEAKLEVSRVGEGLGSCR